MDKLNLRVEVKSMSECKAVCLCDLCHCMLFPGDLCYRLNGLCICRDCLPAFARDVFSTALEMIE